MYHLRVHVVLVLVSFRSGHRGVYVVCVVHIVIFVWGGGKEGGQSTG